VAPEVQELRQWQREWNEENQNFSVASFCPVVNTTDTVINVSDHSEEAQSSIVTGGTDSLKEHPPVTSTACQQPSTSPVMTDTEQQPQQPCEAPASPSIVTCT